jgi:Protein of unknown function (DUF1573)
MNFLKIILPSLFLIFGFVTADAQTHKKGTATKASNKTTHAPVKGPRIKFAKDTVNFGTIKEDAVIEKSFEFTNVGTEDLIITSATGSCGCTLPTFPTHPIAPGEKGVIIVKYTARNKVGRQAPLITVVSNGYPRIRKVSLQGYVEQIPGGVKD